MQVFCIVVNFFGSNQSKMNKNLKIASANPTLY
jgi:hypothetical protein